MSIVTVSMDRNSIQNKYLMNKHEKIKRITVSDIYVALHIILCKADVFIDSQHPPISKKSKVKKPKKKANIIGYTFSCI